MFLSLDIFLIKMLEVSQREMFNEAVLEKCWEMEFVVKRVQTKGNLKAKEITFIDCEAFQI